MNVTSAGERTPAAASQPAATLIVRGLEILLLGLLPALLLLSFLVAGKHFGFDFRQFWRGGRDVLHGVSPYPDAASLHAAPGDLGARAIQKVFRFPYPAGSAVAMVPLALLPFWLAAVFLAVLSIASVALALRVLGVRDWRCYGVAFGSIAVIVGIRLGTLTPLLLLSLALAWRYRYRRWTAGASIASAVVLKVFLWPVVVWLVATRRFAAAAIAVALTVGTTLAAWAAIGFDGLRDYPHLLRRLTDLVADRGFSLVALGSDAGLDGRASHALPWVAGGAALVAAAVAARGRDGDRRAFALAVVASLLLNPIVWLHYFALLYAPIAVWRRSLSGAWLIPLLLWLTPFPDTRGDLWRVALGLAVSGAALAAAAWRTSSASGRLGERRLVG